MGTNEHKSMLEGLDQIAMSAHHRAVAVEAAQRSAAFVGLLLSVAQYLGFRPTGQQSS